MNKLVELHFIDGPLAGTRKMEDEDVIMRNRTYRHLEPMPSMPQQKVSNGANKDWIQVVCTEYYYVPISLPAGLSRNLRFAMCLEKGLG